MMTELPISPDSDQPPQVDPAPVYDSEGRRVGWFSCRFSTERRTTCGSATTIADSALSSTPGPNVGAPCRPAAYRPARQLVSDTSRRVPWWNSVCGVGQAVVVEAFGVFATSAGSADGLGAAHL